MRREVGFYEANGIGSAIKSEDAFTFETGLKKGTIRSTNKMTEGKTCSVVNCGYTTPTKMPDKTELQHRLSLFQLQIGELEIHGAYAHNEGGGTGQIGRVPVAKNAPKPRLGVDRKMWDEFMTRWEIFKTTMRSDGATVPEISETGSRVSRLRPRLASIQSQFRDRDRDFFLVVSTTRLRPRLFSQSLNFEIEIETFFVKSQDRD